MQLLTYPFAAFAALWVTFGSPACAVGLNEHNNTNRIGKVLRRTSRDFTLIENNYEENTVITFCFSAYVTADVEDKGKVAMKDIQVGDKVLTASGRYKTIYSIDHRHPTKTANFIQIQSELQDEAIELTAQHMLFLEGRINPVPAVSVKVGDQLQTLEGSTTVLKVDNITREGIYSPLTLDGTIIVNGIVASSYSSLFTDTEWVEVAGTKLMHMQILLHKLLKPYRYLCMGLSLDLCKTGNERIKYAEYGVYLLSSWLKQNYTIRIVSLLIFVIFVYFADLIVSSYGIFAALLCWMNYAIKSRARRKE